MSHRAPSLTLAHTLLADRYRIEERLGHGGMGVVYAAFDLLSKRKVALKLLPQEAYETSLAPFEREYKTLAGLKHPHIVEVYEFGHCAEGSYYTMELLQGADLSTRAPLPWREVCGYLRDIADILGVLHVRELVHRDLSPRNLWKTSEGALKLIDFGALARFGVADDVVGTPPFVPPEAMAGEPLDQRSDLYSLGALGYWLLTGVHAFPAKAFGELPLMWSRTPSRPSSLLRSHGKQREEPPPPALEELLFSLLRPSPDQRPGHAAELIDKLQAIAGLSPSMNPSAVQAYLESKVFVGRARERERFAVQLKLAERAQAQTLFVEASAGLGRTRLLDELAVAARIGGATTLRLQCAAGGKPYGLMVQVAEQLSACLVDAHDAARARAVVFASLSSQLASGAQALGTLPENHAEAGLFVQDALRDWLVEASRQRLVALLIDDLEQADEESQAILALVARAKDPHKLMLVVSTRRDGARPLAAPAQSLREVATLARLMPLTRSETLDLLRSMFGEAPYLERLAERFYQVSEGNPGHCVELASYLVQSGAARYADGLWILPNELLTLELPRSRAEGIAGRLQLLSERARTVARMLSVPHDGALTRSLCAACVGTELHDLSEPLLELVELGVLKGASETISFSHEQLRDTLFSELSPHERRAVHVRLARALSSDPHDLYGLLSAGLHLIQADHVEEGYRLQQRALAETTDRDNLELGRYAPLVERSYLLLRAGGGDDHACCDHLSFLARAGYLVDRRYGERYGDACIATLTRLLELDLASKLQPYIGGRPALALALGRALLRMPRGIDRAARLQQLLRDLVVAVTCLGAMKALCLDGAATRRYAEALAPLAALGEDHLVGFLYRYVKSFQWLTHDRVGRALEANREHVALLESSTPIRGLKPSLRAALLAGAYASLGLRLSWQDGDEVLGVADKLMHYGPLARMQADGLRATYFANQGKTEEATRYRQRVELHAMQLGTAWQVEIYGPAERLKSAVVSHDALALKRAAQELSRLAEELPMFSQHARSAQAYYALLHGKPEQAIPLLESHETSPDIVGYTRSRGALASAYNALGQHERARAICIDALARTTPLDLTFASMTLGVSLELVLAEAHLGNHARARELLLELHALHASKRGPLTMGALHDTAARVARLAKDYEQCARELEQMRAWYAVTDVPSLHERVETLQRELRQARDFSDEHGEQAPLSDNDLHLVTRVQLLLTRTGHLLTERANKALQIALELSGAEQGFIVMQQTDRATAFVGSEPDAELFGWARQRLMAAYSNDETAAVEDVSELIDVHLKRSNNLSYCVAPLWARRDQEDVLVGALALGFGRSTPKLPGADVLSVLADSLVKSGPA